MKQGQLADKRSAEALQFRCLPGLHGFQKCDLQQKTSIDLDPVGLLNTVGACFDGRYLWFFCLLEWSPCQRPTAISPGPPLPLAAILPAY
jgi:hypothetical protein